MSEQASKELNDLLQQQLKNGGTLDIVWESSKFKIEVYLDDGRVFEYEVANAGKVREHAHAIIMTGYRHTDETGLFEWYPPHRIMKIKSQGLPTKYTDKTTGT